MSYTPKVARHKVEAVGRLAELIRSYPMVGVVNMENIPARQLQKMRSQLRKSVLILMSKKPMIDRAIDACEEHRKGLSGLKKHTARGMPALLFTNEDPFRLAAILKKSRTAAPAKPGQLAPRDIVIQAGPTPFAPGPIISELSGVGLKTGVEGGKVTVKEDKVIVHEGDKISQKVSDVLTKLGIQPMEIGLDLVAVYEEGVIYTRDVLSVDEASYLMNVRQAAAEAMGLAVQIGYPAPETIRRLMGKAFSDAKALVISRDIMSDVLAGRLITEAERQALSIRSRLPAVQGNQ